MVKYGKVWYNKYMKITITIPNEVYDKLERDRGMVPRSTWLQRLIMGNKKEAKEEKGSKEEVLDKLVKSGVVKKGAKELPSQGDGEFKTYFKERKGGKQG